MYSTSSLAAVGHQVDIQPGGLLQLTPALIERQSAGGHTWEPQPPCTELPVLFGRRQPLPGPVVTRKPATDQRWRCLSWQLLSH